MICDVCEYWLIAVAVCGVIKNVGKDCRVIKTNSHDSNMKAHGFNFLAKRQPHRR